MKKNNLMKKIMCFVLFAAVLGTGLFPAFVKAAGDGPSIAVKSVIQWKRVRTYEDLPPDTNVKYYMFLAWTDNGKDPNLYAADDFSWYCATDKTGTYSHGTDALIGSQLATTEYGYFFPVDMDEFVTDTPHGMPQIIYAGTDSGNKYKDNTTGKDVSSPRYLIKLNEGKGKYVCEDGSDNFKFREGESTKWGIMVHEPGDEELNKYESSAKYESTVCLFYNRSGDRDSGFKIHSEKIACPKDKDFNDFDPFVMWIGRETHYSCINSDYAVMPGETLDIQNDGIYVENGVTLTVYPGATLSVSGTVINNGQIKNYGTLIIQEGGAMFPLPGQHGKGSSVFDPDSNRVTCIGGKATVSVPGYKKKIVCEGAFLNFGAVGFSDKMGGLSLEDGSVMENHGFLLTGRDLYVADSALKNYGSAALGFAKSNLAAIQKLTAKSPWPSMESVGVNEMNFFLLGKSVAKNYQNAKVSVCDDALTDLYFTEG